MSNGTAFPNWYVTFQAAVLQQLPRPDKIDRDVALGLAENQAGLKKFLEGLCPPEAFIENRIHVDRSVRPAYPDWANQKWINSKEFIALEATGPADYDPSSLKLSLHPKQEQGGVGSGHEVYTHQRKLGLGGCLGLADLLALQRLGIQVFRQHFQGKAVFAWKNVVQDDDGSLSVPYLVECGGQVDLRWRWLGGNRSVSDPALRLAS